MLLFLSELFSDGKGIASMMRFLVFWSAMIGTVTILCGLFLGHLEASTRVVCIVTGAGLIAGGQGAKAIQKNAEVKSGR